MSVAFAGAVPMPCRAQENPNPKIQNRITNFRDMGSAFKNIGDELKSRRPDIARIRESSNTILGYSQQLPRWFPPDSKPPPTPKKSWFARMRDWITPASTGQGHDNVSHAKPEIWTKTAEFRADARRFLAAAASMKKAADTGNLAEIGSNFRSLGATCNTCHSTFREKLH